MLFLCPPLPALISGRCRRSCTGYLYPDWSYWWCSGGFETRLALIAAFDSATITFPLILGHLGMQKYPLHLCHLFVCVVAAFGLDPGGLSVEAVVPDVMLLGVGVFSPTEAALSEKRFLCRKFHYIRVQQGGGGVRRQLGCGTGTLGHNRRLLSVNMLAHRWKGGYRPEAFCQTVGRDVDKYLKNNLLYCGLQF